MPTLGTCLACVVRVNIYNLYPDPSGFRLDHLLQLKIRPVSENESRLLLPCDTLEKLKLYYRSPLFDGKVHTLTANEMIVASGKITLFAFGEE